MSVLGCQILSEFYGCDRDILNHVGRIKELMNEAARICGASILGSVFHRFNPHGVSGVVVIAESHMAIHTWPEYGLAAVDLFTCGKGADPWQAQKFLAKGFDAQSISTKEIRRGEIMEGRDGVEQDPTLWRNVEKQL